MIGGRSDGGSSIDRNEPIEFVWAGRTYRGFAGDTLASALLANGVAIIGRSFKYHRPRGLVAAGLEEPNAIVQLERGAHTVPNVKATQVEIYEGLVADPVNCDGRPNFDPLAINSLAKRFIPAAFYYKTFFWPGWHFFEPMIRKMAGLGVAPSVPDPDVYDHRFAHADVLVVGAGPAGLAAAEAAAATPGTERVLLVEADFEFGGELLSTTSSVEGMAPRAWRDEVLARLRAAPNVELLNRTMAFGFYDHGLVALCERLTDHIAPAIRSGPRQRLWKVRARKVILATGAFERPLAFQRNDLPGVMLASAARTYARRFGAVPGNRVVLCTNNDSAYDAAFALHDAGCDIVAIVDSRAEPGRTAHGAVRRGIPVVQGAVPRAAHGRRGVRALTFEKLGGCDRGRLRCDAVLMSGGWNPAVHLHSQAGGSLSYDDRLASFLPDKIRQHAASVGAARGDMELEPALADARRAPLGNAEPFAETRPVGPCPTFVDGDSSAQQAWVDFQNDVTVADVQLAARENFRSIEHLKRYTTLGMASDQGKTSNVVGIHILSGLLAKPAPAIGTTKFRPPFDPVTIGAFAGRAVGDRLIPLARTATHDPQVAIGAKMESYGQWVRAAYFPRADETERQAIDREVLAVRRSAGLFDASPLGKVEVKGPDAAEFLHRMYVNNIRSLKIGQCRYALMLDEHGIVYDDGIVTRLGQDHFLAGTTSGHAAAVADRFREWSQCEWPDLRVMIENVTTNWAVINIAGPNARRILGKLEANIDLSTNAFPHMTCRSGSIGGVAARIQRVSFSGELSYEIAVPWRYGASLWNALMSAGAGDDITAFGVEALMVMRVEKGFLHVGSDTDGTTYPQDIGFGGVLAKKAGDFVGRRSTMRSDALRDDRRHLVGIEMIDGSAPVEVGAHVLPVDATEARGTDGWITSSIFSPTLDRPLALALVQRGIPRTGEEVRLWDLGKWRCARIVDPRFFDPTGEKLDG